MNSPGGSGRNPIKDYCENEIDEERHRMTLKKLPPRLTETMLDLGVENPLTPILRQTYPELEIINTPTEVDFDVDALPFADKRFEILFSFEVLEHLMNPLWNLTEGRHLLSDGGTI